MAPDFRAPAAPAHQLDKLLDTLPGGGRKKAKRTAPARPATKGRIANKAIAAKTRENLIEDAPLRAEH